MRVLHVSSANSIRGGEHQVILLINYLSQLDVESVLVCPSGSELSKLSIPQLDKLITYVKISPANILVSAFIKKIAVEENIDIIHIHDPHSHQFVFFSYKLFANKIPAVATRRVSFPIKKTSRPYYSHPMVRKIISVSESVFNSLDKLDLQEGKRIVIPSGIPIDIEESQRSLRDEYNVKPTTKIIANLAALSPQKDYLTFVRTAREFIDTSDLDVLFFIIGADGGTLEEVKNLVSELALENHVVFTGYLADGYRYLSDVDVLLSTSVSEGLGNTVMEAMKYKVPIVATSCEGTVDLLKHQQNALLADIGAYQILSKHLIDILTDLNLTLQLTDAAFEIIQQYDVKKTTANVKELYHTVLMDQ